MAQEAGIPVEGVNQILEGSADTVSLDYPLYPNEIKSDSDGSQTTFLDLVSYDDLPLQDSIAAKLELKRRLEDLFSLLTKREEKILKMRFGIDSNYSTLSDVADIFNLTQERIRQIQGEVLYKLKRSEGGEVLRDFL